MTKKQIDVTAALIVKGGEVLAARRAPGKHLAGFWEFPGGKIEAGETPEACLARELTEEFGITASIGAYLGESVYDYGAKVVRLLGFDVAHTSGDFTLTDHDQLRWLGMDELFEVAWAPADIPLVHQYETRARTMAYYSGNAAEYCVETSQLNASGIYDPFLAHLPANGSILDLGCGSGRDSKAFREMGYQVTSVDGNPEIAAWASEYTGHPVTTKTFQEINYVQQFDGVWASASLLHCHQDQLGDALGRIVNSLKDGGVAYMSFKWGTQDSIDDRGRPFTNQTTDTLRKLLGNLPGAAILDVWRNEMLLRGRLQKWAYGLIRKTGGDR